MKVINRVNIGDVRRAFGPMYAEQVKGIAEFNVEEDEISKERFLTGQKPGDSHFTILKKLRSKVKLNILMGTDD